MKKKDIQAVSLASAVRYRCKAEMSQESLVCELWIRVLFQLCLLALGFALGHFTADPFPGFLIIFTFLVLYLALYRYWKRKTDDACRELENKGTLQEYLKCDEKNRIMIDDIRKRHGVDKRGFVVLWKIIECFERKLAGFFGPLCAGYVIAFGWRLLPLFSR